MVSRKVSQYAVDGIQQQKRKTTLGFRYHSFRNMRLHETGLKNPVFFHVIPPRGNTQVCVCAQSCSAKLCLKRLRPLFFYYRPCLCLPWSGLLFIIQFHVLMLKFREKTRCGYFKRVCVGPWCRCLILILSVVVATATQPTFFFGVCRDSLMRVMAVCNSAFSVWANYFYSLADIRIYF